MEVVDKITKAFRSSVDTSSNKYLMVPIFIFFSLLILAMIRSPIIISQSGIGSAIILSAPLILTTYALTFIVMAGRGGVDLSIGPFMGFINVSSIPIICSWIFRITCWLVHLCYRHGFNLATVLCFDCSVRASFTNYSSIGRLFSIHWN